MPAAICLPTTSSGLSVRLSVERLHLLTVDLSYHHLASLCAAPVSARQSASHHSIPWNLGHSPPPPPTYLGWRRGVVVSGVCRMNEVNARRARLVLGWVTWVTVFGPGIPSRYVTSQLGQLSLAFSGVA